MFNKHDNLDEGCQSLSPNTRPSLGITIRASYISITSKPAEESLELSRLSLTNWVEAMGRTRVQRCTTLNLSLGHEKIDVDLTLEQISHESNTTIRVSS